MPDDPRWMWLEKRLEEIHGDVRRINGSVRRHEADLAVLSSVSHAPGCHVSQALREQMEEWMREHEVQKAAGAVTTQAAAAVRARDVMWLGGLLWVVSLSAQLLAQWLWR